MLLARLTHKSTPFTGERTRYWLTFLRKYAFLINELRQQQIYSIFMSQTTQKSNRTHAEEIFRRKMNIIFFIEEEYQR